MGRSGRQTLAIALLSLSISLVTCPGAATPFPLGFPHEKPGRSEVSAASEQPVAEESRRLATAPDESIQSRQERMLSLGIAEAEQIARTLSQRFAFALSGFPQVGREIAFALDRLMGGGGIGRLLAAVGAACMPFLAGFAAELALARRLRTATRRLTAHAGVPVLALPRIVGLGILHLSRIAVFLLVALAVIILLLPDGGLSRKLALFYALPVLWLRFILLALWLLVMPAAPHLRLLPSSNSFARHLFSWAAAFFIVTVFSYSSIRLLSSNGLDDRVNLLLTILEISLSLCILLALVWTSPGPTLPVGAQAAPVAPTGAKRGRSRDWRPPATAFLGILLLAYVVSALLGRHEFRWALLWSLASIPVFIAADTAMRGTVQAALANGAIGQDQDSAVLSVHAGHFMRGFRVLLAAAWAFLLLWIWGVRFSFAGAVTRMVFSIVVTVVLGWFVWEWTRSAIDQRLHEDSNEQGEESEEREDVEEMGIGGSRKATLLTLARKFILVVIFASTGLILLSSLGIDIGPLLAGAGIAGLAIGFGAQALVKDILSGVFFLLDDAFRLGDYIEADTHKGTVVHISVRSLKLRHPRGKLLTIPYGSLGAITNYSRDWAIMKLDLRVPFDTDLEKVRKIIKKLGQNLSEDKELGPKFLAPLKSQGVREIDDSAMIVRVKFKSRPHDQFILRREVFKHIQNKFAESGIEFAPRKVTIHIPESYLGSSRKELDMGIMAAAAETTLERKLPQGDTGKDKQT